MGVSVSSLQPVLESLKQIPLIGDAKELIKNITSHHRIQGSLGLDNAIKEVANILEEIGLEIKLFDVPSSASKNFMETPISWDILSGSLEIKSGDSLVSRLDYVDHPTLISAHTPPSEGCSEIKFCKDIFECDGESVLLEAPAFIAYKELSSRLIVLFDSKRYPEAVPYSGLFIKENEVKGTSVVNIPYNLALKIMSLFSKNMKVEVCWKVNTKFSSRPMHGLLAYRGEEPGVLYVSHICHPKPGAHDNASGVVANILTAKLLEKTKERTPHAHLFIPEYSGTIYAGKALPWKPLSVINLDMVGSKQWITNSTLNMVNAPLFVKNLSAAYVFLATKLVLDDASSFGGFKLPGHRYSVTPYTAGSDHDVTIMWGLDSVMLNEWPSKYYHTDMDDIESISIVQLVNTALIASLAGINITNKYREETLLSIYRDYLKSWYSMEALKVNMDVSNISKVMENQVTIPYDHERTPISSRYLYDKIGTQKYLKLRNTKGAYTFLTVYAPLGSLAGVQDIFEIFQLENLLQWSREERGLVEETWSLIKDELRW